MASPKTLNPAHKALVRRYLIWAYKSTKESFDRLERKTTQLMADEYILRVLSGKKTKGGEGYDKLVGEFKDYIVKKQQQPVPQGQYLYLRDRLDAVEGAIKYFLGVKELNSIRAGYEEEFTRRIWGSKDH